MQSVQHLVSNKLDDFEFSLSLFRSPFHFGSILFLFLSALTGSPPKAFPTEYLQADKTPVLLVCYPTSVRVLIKNRANFMPSSPAEKNTFEKDFQTVSFTLMTSHR